jgi:hypothetical protein
MALPHLALAGGAPLLDLPLAQVEARTVAASDVALARGLGVLGFTPSTEPIDRSDVQRFVDALLIVEEAGRIGLSVDPADAERAWAAVERRLGAHGKAPGRVAPGRPAARDHSHPLARGALRGAALPPAPRAAQDLWPLMLARSSR